MTTPPFFGSFARIVVGHVARDVAEGARRGMREDDGRLETRSAAAHRLGRDVREVHEHAEPVHLAHDLDSPNVVRPPRRTGGSVALSAQSSVTLCVSVM